MKKLTFLAMVLGIIFIATGNTFAINDNAVQIFAHKDFDTPRGNITYELPAGENEKSIYSFAEGSGFNDAVSSVIVGKGVKVILYKDGALKGDKLVLYPGEYKDFSMNFGDNPWNDKVSSLKIQRLSDPNLPLIKLTYYSGFTQMIGLDGIDEFKNDWCLLRDNDVEYADIPAAYKVRFYDDFRYEGDSHPEPIKGGDGVRIRMDDLMLRAKVSSIKIEWNKYALTKVVMKKTETQPPPPGKVSLEPMGSDTVCDHRAATVGIYQCEKTLTSEYEATATTSWDNSTTVGITATTTVKASAGVEGVASGSVEQSLALSVANEFRIGKQESTSVKQTATDKVNITLNPGEGLGFTLEVIPAAVTYDVTYIYTSVDDDGKPDGKAKDREAKGKMTINSASTTQAISYDLPGAKKSASVQPAAEQGMVGAAWEWIKSSPCRLWDFVNRVPEGQSTCRATTATNTNATTPAASPNPSTDTK